MAQQCPLIFRHVDATVTRINTLFVILGIIAFLVTQSPIVLILLIVDFILRLYGYKHLSPINISSLFIQKTLSLEVKMEDAGAKRLAAFFGTGFTIALLISSWIGADVAIAFISGIFLFCAALELLFGYCIACKIYYIAKKLYPKGFE
ncbi:MULTISPECIES: DUF4395 domain-containing protein [unclassified Sulfuricurvum]|uniref:DUF4395 domain-containing protein n=1 Tax=unclassified Sulfuricurvum TaxID=2632390 RepID=UPI0002999A91|nr:MULTISPECIES: DUF4395 domain-containing protein [unclassified Sulfuricurvum]OHD80795.1 MAG: hypothetical protein A3D90_00930 [Sulfuricurvum sp. RIFCSPHIGHO2_02_FULL_43_9]OHD83274.1 MAG: hypothetical protein A3J39_04805 [Sulfuricurvum sp. RIFCSPHIGHO2_12_FULL_44_8]OHD84455.1 MAG: hypothetical protein A2Y52_05985 [Sulfuricurvum sp. RIFCSPLOWO2_02_43_6]OHD85738.1 MAG: hypothetical protein A3I60_03590 [Sulfuricurvum sp. RIFCSPLOWO2_02_FULL_43_45]AFV97251.1 hypothetical protein B649_04685 [Candi